MALNTVHLALSVAAQLRELAAAEKDPKRAEMLREKADLHETGARAMARVGHG